ncbi:MAG TPA: carbohydrate-binding domain-containing protein [Candidatus Anaerotruncus excrementipullorum]|uniref:Carbohydrate-binding domain-containing protein n=1 Tax=Candidatus Anaerotruncus excrementipullorum TaxID=2838465 RepID=A0A9D1WQJ4_9FIRM|nr:carbohydrate-binding domain-containing protein [Candidatus Anaerotruncus excrementipullorum]
MRTIGKHSLCLGLAAALALGLAACGQPQQTSSPAASSPSASSQAAGEGAAPAAAERQLTLSPEGAALDGQPLAEGETGAVTVSHDIVYYQADQGPGYGEGAAEEEHTAEEAAAHTVVTIREPGTYRVSGQLPQGQLAVDLGQGAAEDPEAVVTVILDGAEVTCTVAPAFLAYNVYECGDREGDSPTVDTSGAGIRVVLADGSQNRFTGSHVARIYQEGTTEKLHKYDGAFYSKMSMVIEGEQAGTGSLWIEGDNEGLDSELHLTINGGEISISAQDDGINTNEDGVSVTTVNGGTLRVEGGLGAEGDGIDSNGHLVINGGSVYASSNQRSPDGGLDADGQILLNGGTVVALGVRNDAASSSSAQQYLELSFASTLPAGSQVVLANPAGEALFDFTTGRAAQSVTLSSPQLEQGVDYTLTVDGVVQAYTGHQAGGFPGRPGGFGGPRGERPQPPEGMEPPKGMTEPPEGMAEPPEGMPEPPEGMAEPPEGMTERPDRPAPPQQPTGGAQEAAGGPSTRFTLEEGVHTFSGITGSAQESGRTAVTFTAQLAVGADGSVTLSNVQADQPVDASHIQLTVTDQPSEDYAASCLLSEGEEALAAILPTQPGDYQLTIGVFGEEAYTGSSQFAFTIPG